MAQTSQIVVTSRWPLHKGTEVGARYDKVGKEKGPSPAINSFKVYHTSTLKGWQLTIYYEVDVDKMGEALLYLNDFLGEFMDIEGYTFEISLAVTGEELTAFLASRQG